MTTKSIEPSLHLRNNMQVFVENVREEFFSDDPELAGNSMICDPDARFLVIVSVPENGDDNYPTPSDIFFNVYQKCFDNPAFRNELIHLINKYED